MGRFGAVPQPFGFVPYGDDVGGAPVLPKKYAISSGNNATGVAVGDLVLVDGAGGAKTQASVGAYDGSSSDLLGVVAAVYDAYGKSISGIHGASELTAGHALTAAQAGYVSIYNPYVVRRFIALEDGDTTPIADASIGLNVAVISTAKGATGKSTFKIDSTSVNTTATLPFRLVEVHPDDTGTAGTDSRVYVVEVNHFPNQSIQGTTAVS